MDYNIEKKNLDEEKSSLFGTKVKKFKNNDQGIITYILKTVFCLAILETYFILNHILKNRRNHFAK